MLRSMRGPRGTRRAFTLTELAVIIVLVAVVMAVLVPTLMRARSGARRSQCLLNAEQVVVALTGYAIDAKEWYPVVPVPARSRLWESQNIYGGVAGLFSLDQEGDSAARGFIGGAYADGNATPLLAGYLKELGVLTCPADAQDHAPMGAEGGASVEYIPANLGYPPGGPVKRPRAPRAARDVINYNVSYLYIAGMRHSEPLQLAPAPIWGDETDCYDVGPLAWYGAGASAAGAQTAASGAGGAPCAGRYGALDAHGVEGGTFGFTDGHGEFVRGSVFDSYLRAPQPGAAAPPRNVNAGEPMRASRLRVMD